MCVIWNFAETRSEFLSFDTFSLKVQILSIVNVKKNSQFKLNNLSFSEEINLFSLIKLLDYKMNNSFLKVISRIRSESENDNERGRLFERLTKIFLENDDIQKFDMVLPLKGYKNQILKTGEIVFSKFYLFN